MPIRHSTEDAENEEFAGVLKRTARRRIVATLTVVVDADKIDAWVKTLYDHDEVVPEGAALDVVGAWLAEASDHVRLLAPENSGLEVKTKLRQEGPTRT
jgi:hypothetical protein